MNTETQPFVESHSIVRAIWGHPDAVLLIFAGAAAEFALSRAVDWLFFTGTLPRDPLGRLFSTAEYARTIVFADAATAERTLARITAIHRAVEQRRGQAIPAWASRAVLYMLIDYSERAYQLLKRPLTSYERAELYAVFRRVGVGLGIGELPLGYGAWRVERDRQLRRDLAWSDYTARLYDRYREVLGHWRYLMLLGMQRAIVPPQVRRLLGLRPQPAARHLLRLYGGLAAIGLRPYIQILLVPPSYLAQVRQLGAPVARRAERLFEGP
jgi:uncharacterized protein (DUF2236 family)